jgi:hypothetical protein
MAKFSARHDVNAQEQPSNMRCIYCKHFRNSPTYLEEEIKGLSTMSSGHASVRKDDGICLKNDVYLSARDWCESFETA